MTHSQLEKTKTTQHNFFQHVVRINNNLSVEEYLKLYLRDVSTKALLFMNLNKSILEKDDYYGVIDDFMLNRENTDLGPTVLFVKLKEGVHL